MSIFEQFYNGKRNGILSTVMKITTEEICIFLHHHCSLRKYKDRMECIKKLYIRRKRILNAFSCRPSLTHLRMLGPLITPLLEDTKWIYKVKYKL